jgi:hypothetical protein
MLNIACLKEAITSFEQHDLSFIKKGGALAPLLYTIYNLPSMSISQTIRSTRIAAIVGSYPLMHNHPTSLGKRERQGAPSHCPPDSVPLAPWQGRSPAPPFPESSERTAQ